jgi:hypothetical protein
MKHIVLARIDAGYAYDGTAAIMMHFRLVLTQRSVQQAYKFTGKERDTESGLDNFGARYNVSLRQACGSVGGSRSMKLSEEEADAHIDIAIDFRLASRGGA